MLSNSHLNLSPQAAQSLLTLWFLQDFNSHIRALIVWSKWPFSYVLDLNCNKLPPNLATSNRNNMYYFAQILWVRKSWTSLLGCLTWCLSQGDSHLKTWLGLEDLLPCWQTDAACWQETSFSHHKDISIAAWVLTKWPLIFPENKWPKQTQGESHNVFRHLALEVTFCISTYSLGTPGQL